MATVFTHRRLPAWCRDDRGWPLAAAGVGLVASGLAHVAAWAAFDGPWEGAVTWRKPILFGISGGLTALSLGWAWACLPRRRGDAWLAAATAAALVAEVALIDLQRWRGVASHFNRATPFDAALYDVMTWLILGVTLVIGDLTLRFFLQRPRLSADMLLAARAGLGLLFASCLLGIWTGAQGEIRRAAGLPPETLGAAGVLKFPHGAALHAVQWLPFVAWAAERAGFAIAARTRLVAWSTAGSVLLCGYALAQTLLGRARFDATPLTAGVLAAAAVMLAVPVAWIAFRQWRKPPGLRMRLTAP
ncbi:MAG: hypothetical protein ACKO4Z_09945 [Planctomycetota bacterium]